MSLKKKKINLNDNDLFNRNHCFFKQYISAKKSKDLLTKALNDEENFIPRRMLNSIQRLVTLAEDMDKIRPGKRSLSLFFLITCIEAVYTLNNSMLTKQTMIIDFFTRFLSQEEKDFLFDRLAISKEEDDTFFINPVNAEMFALFLVAVRNNVAHEGDYSSIQFKAKENSCGVIYDVKAKLKKDEGNKELIYQIDFTYQRLKNLCVKGLIRYVENYYQQTEIDLT